MSRVVKKAIFVAVGWAAAPILIGGGSVFAATSLVKIGLNAAIAGAVARKAEVDLEDLRRAQQPRPSLIVQQASPEAEIIYGRCRVRRSSVIFAENEGDAVWLVIPLACHEIEELVALYDGDTPMWSSADGVEEGFAKRLDVYWRGGTDDQVAIPELIEGCDSLDADFRGRGIAYVALKLKNFAKRWENTPPRLWAEVKGAKVYDPRTGTRAFSSNLALIKSDYMQRSRGGPGLTNIQAAALGASADLCDEWVADQGSYADSGAAVWASEMHDGVRCHRRYEFNGAISTASRPMDVLNDLSRYDMGSVVYARGEYLIRSGAYRTPVASYTSADLLGAPQVTHRRKLESRIDGVRGSFSDPSANYNPTDFEEVELDGDPPAGEAPNYHDVALSGEIHPERAQRLAVLSARSVQRSMEITVTMPLGAIVHESGDVVDLELPEVSIDGTFEVVEVVLALDESGPHVRLSLLETSASVWDWDAATVSARPVAPSNAFGVGATVAPPSSLAVENASWTATDGTTVGALRASWSASADPFVSDYRVTWSRSGESLGSALTGGALELTLPGFIPGDDIAVSVEAMGLAGRSSEAVSDSLVIAGDTVAPPVPQSWVGWAGHDTITLTGQPSDAPDFAFFRIYGATDSSDELTWLDETSGTAYLRQPADGDLLARYRVAAVDRSGNESSLTPFISVVPDPSGLSDLDPEVSAALNTLTSTALDTRDLVAQLGDSADSLAADAVLAQVRGYEQERTDRAAVAEVDERLTERVDDQEGALAALEQTLTASFGEALAVARQSLTARITDGNAAMAEQVTTLAASQSGLDALITRQATAIAGLGASIQFVLDVNGSLSGWLLSSEVDPDNPSRVTAAFDFVADAFRISGPSGEVTPFEVITTEQTINNVVVSPGVYMDGAFIRAGSITSLQIGDVLESENFDEGSAGWQLRRDGSAEFRGLVIARDMVVDQITHEIPDQDLPNHGTFTETLSFFVNSNVDSADFVGNEASYAATAERHRLVAIPADAITTSTNDPDDCEWGFTAEIVPCWMYSAGDGLGSARKLRVKVTLYTRRITRIEYWWLDIKVLRVS